MGVGAVVRPVEAGDFGAIAQITNHYIATTAIHFSSDPIPAEEQRASWEKTRERYPYLVAAVAGEIVGYAKASLWRERAAYSWTPECGIYIRHDRHGRGLGRLLYERLFELLTVQGFQTLIAGVTLPNAVSVRLHESMGFVPAGVIQRAGWKFGQWWDVGFWQRPLAAPGAAAGPLRTVTEAEEILATRRALPGL